MRALTEVFEKLGEDHKDLFLISLSIKLIKNKSLRPLWFGIVVLCQTL